MSSKVLAGRYELLEKIGDGGMAVVYRAMDKLLNRLVAVKILKPQYTEDEKFINNFRKESHAAASLNHANIVGVYDVGREGNINYIVMELVRGKPLSDVIKEEGPLDYKRTIDLAKQIASGLSAAHKQGIIHRDVKPHNILINEDGVAKIADFGIAKAVSVSTIVDATGENNIIGSVHYFSPEQARGGYVDVRSDLYSLGIVMYEMITGQVPFDGDNPVSVALMQINDPMTPPSKLVSLPPALEKIILKATDKLAMNRYQTAEEMIRALDDIELVSRVVGDSAMTGAATTGAKTSEIVALREAAENTVVEEDEPKKKKTRINKKRMALVGGIFVAALLLLIAIGFASGLLGKAKVSVPNLTGMTFQEAEDELEKYGLEIKEGDLVYSTEYEIGQVVSQDPKKGTEVKEGAVITVNLSKGPTDGTVPNVIGMTQEQAEELIKKYDFEVGNVTTDTSVEPYGTVIRQDPVQGTEALNGSAINLVISDGQGKNAVKVPVLTGLTKSEAEAKLAEVKLSLGKIDYDASTTYSKDVIMRQSYDAGTEVDEGTSVDIVISTGASSTISIEVPYDMAENDVFSLTIMVTDDNGTRNVITGQQTNKEDGSGTFSIKGTGAGTITVIMDGETVMTLQADFVKGQLVEP